MRPVRAAVVLHHMRRPDGLSEAPPACGYWTIDGVAVGAMIPLPDSLLGSVVVVRAERSTATQTCGTEPCRSPVSIFVSQLLWSGSLVLEPAPPLPAPSVS